MKKQLSVITALLLLSSTLSFGQGITINRDIYGINAWYIDAKGAGTSTFAATFESELNAVKASGCRYVRIGGIAPNWDQLYNFNPQNLSIITPVNRLEYLITKIREAGMDVIIQVSYNPSCPNYTLQSGYNPLGPLTLQQQATVAANLVDYLNNTWAPANKQDPIQYWIVSNEPDLPLGTCSNPKGYSMASQNEAVNIAGYLKAFSTAMKNKFSSIKIIGPEIASFTTDDNGPVNEMMVALISNPTSSAATSVMGQIPSGNAAAGQWYVDVVSFHYYPGSSNNSKTLVRDNPTHTTSGFAAKLNSTGISGRTGLVEMITAAGRTINDCRIACTEFNLDNTTNRNESTHFVEMIQEWDNRSFVGGQWVCEVFAEAFKQT